MPEGQTYEEPKLCWYCRQWPCKCNSFDKPVVRLEELGVTNQALIMRDVYKEQRDRLLAAAKAVIETAGNWKKEEQHANAVSELEDAVKECEP